jgi:hypothetical protein
VTSFFGSVVRPPGIWRLAADDVEELIDDLDEFVE